MANSYKILGQAAPAADADTLLYTAPALTNSVISTFSIVNRAMTGVAASYRIAVVPLAEALSLKHFIRYDALIDPRDDHRMTLGVTLAAGDKIYVRADTANVSFSVFGAEIT